MFLPEIQNSDWPKMSKYSHDNNDYFEIFDFFDWNGKIVFKIRPIYWQNRFCSYNHIKSYKFQTGKLNANPRNKLFSCRKTYVFICKILHTLEDNV